MRAIFCMNVVWLALAVWRLERWIPPSSTNHQQKRPSHTLTLIILYHNKNNNSGLHHFLSSHVTLKVNNDAIPSPFHALHEAPHLPCCDHSCRLCPAHAMEAHGTLQEQIGKLNCGIDDSSLVCTSVYAIHLTETLQRLVHNKCCSKDMTSLSCCVTYMTWMI